METFRKIVFRILTVLFLFTLITPGAGCAARSNGQAQKKNGDSQNEVDQVQNEIAKGNEEMVTANTTNNPDTEAAPVSNVRFESKLTPAEDSITVNYTVVNSSDKDIYLLDAYPAVNENRQAYADLKAFYLSYREPSTAFVLKGVPPPPARPAAVRVMPLGTKMEPNAKVSREFKIPLPLRERSDWYYPPLPPEEYTMGSVDKISLRVQFIRSGVEGFEVKPAHYAPEFAIVTAKEFVKQVETLKAEHGIAKAQLFIRKDMFTRM
jgi:hypothetical protein